MLREHLSLLAELLAARFPVSGASFSTKISLFSDVLCLFLWYILLKNPPGSFVL
jgi:hypothetical protein